MTPEQIEKMRAAHASAIVSGFYSTQTMARECVEAIPALLSAVEERDRLHDQLRWRKFAEERPDEGQSVLFHVAGGFAVACLLGSGSGEWHWFDESDEGGKLYQRQPHSDDLWMPVPPVEGKP